ncbi:MAG: hypothetical protein ACI8TQ_000090 [Planctomycetota bacterium]|jgi:hypothetical protein
MLIWTLALRGGWSLLPVIRVFKNHHKVPGFRRLRIDHEFAGRSLFASNVGSAPRQRPGPATFTSHERLNETLDLIRSSPV